MKFICFNIRSWLESFLILSYEIYSICICNFMKFFFVVGFCEGVKFDVYYFGFFILYYVLYKV